MTPEQLAEIEARAMAFPEEWINMPDGLFFGEMRTVETFTLIAKMPELDDRTAEFEFFAASRANILALCAEVRRLQVIEQAAKSFLEADGVAKYTAYRELLTTMGYAVEYRL